MSEKINILNHLKGGIGNQLFQHAFAQSLSKRLNIPLFTDISYYSKDSYGFKPVIFELCPEIQRSSLVDHSGPGSFILSEGQIESINQIQKIFPDVKNLVLDGYWQGESYFDENVGLEIYNKLEKRATEYLDQKFIDRVKNNKNSLSVHVRRKDYGHMGVCKVSYYIAAIEHIVLNHPDVEIFVFSDEPNFTRHLMAQNNWSYTLINSGDDLNDLYLMSLCKYFVISNSSYSWWGAWFGEHSSKDEDTIVIAPEEWVTIDSTPSPCPARWIQIENAVDIFEILTPEIKSQSVRIQKSRFQTAIQDWFTENGDQTLRLQFENLTENSLVFDLGGYQGDWTYEITQRYDAVVMVFEPIKNFCDKIRMRFNNNPKVIAFPFGLGSENKLIEMRQNGNASGAFVDGESHQANLQNAAEFLTQYNVQKIDLMKINIEGGEYDLLEHLIASGDIHKIKKIQIQFHDFVPDAITRRARIINDLSRTHIQKWSFYFVWEEWVIK